MEGGTGLRESPEDQCHHKYEKFLPHLPNKLVAFIAKEAADEADAMDA
jgi:hypothetical protein